MKNRVLAVLATVLSLSATAAVAQAPAGGPPPGGMGGGQGGGNRRMQAMLNGITLTAPQQAQFDSINAKYQAQMPAFTPGTPPDSTARATRMRLTTARDAELRAVLTPAQQTIWDTNLANMPQRGPRP